MRDSTQRIVVERGDWVIHLPLVVWGGDSKAKMYTFLLLKWSEVSDRKIGLNKNWRGGYVTIPPNISFHNATFDQNAFILLRKCTQSSLNKTESLQPSQQLCEAVLRHSSKPKYWTKFDLMIALQEKSGYLMEIYTSSTHFTAIDEKLHTGEKWKTDRAPLPSRYQCRLKSSKNLYPYYTRK